MGGYHQPHYQYIDSHCYNTRAKLVHAHLKDRTFPPRILLI